MDTVGERRAPAPSSSRLGMGRPLPLERAAAAMTTRPIRTRARPRAQGRPWLPSSTPRQLTMRVTISTWLPRINLNRTSSRARAASSLVLLVTRTSVKITSRFSPCPTFPLRRQPLPLPTHSRCPVRLLAVASTTATTVFSLPPIVRIFCPQPRSLSSTPSSLTLSFLRKRSWPHRRMPPEQSTPFARPRPCKSAEQRINRSALSPNGMDDLGQAINNLQQKAAPRRIVKRQQMLNFSSQPSGAGARGS